MLCSDNQDIILVLFGGKSKIWRLLIKSTRQKLCLITFVNFSMILKGGGEAWATLFQRNCSSFGGILLNQLFTILIISVLSIFLYTSFTFEIVLDTHIWKDTICVVVGTWKTYFNFFFIINEDQKSVLQVLAVAWMISFHRRAPNTLSDVNDVYRKMLKIKIIDIVKSWLEKTYISPKMMQFPRNNVSQTSPLLFQIFERFTNVIIKYSFFQVDFIKSLQIFD